jgi:hypothetical protein
VNHTRLQYPVDVLEPEPAASTTRHAPRRSRDLPSHASPQASHDVQRDPEQGDPGYLQEVHEQRTFIHISICQYMLIRTCLQPLEIFVDDETKLTLHGLQQYYLKLEESQKNRKLNDLLDTLDFNQVRIFSAIYHPFSHPFGQVVIFVKSVARAVELDKLLRECSFPCITVHSNLNQEERYDTSCIPGGHFV